jgi:hypothetical protein
MATPSKRERNARTVAVLLPPELHSAVMEAAGREGVSLAEWMRAACRQRARAPLAFPEGYAEGKSAAWSDVNARVRAALEQAFEDAQ